MTDTIAAIATPPGEGGLGVIRLSGAESLRLASKFFHAADGLALAEQAPRYLSFGRWLEPKGGKLLDEVLCVRFQAPQSFTGEDVVELHAHGGTFHLQKLLQGLLESGARLAKPGEFTQRAFLNGRMDLTKAEAVADLIRSGTDLARDAASRQLSGGLAELIERLREALIDLNAQVEAAVDFPDEEDQLLPKAGLLEKVRALLSGTGALLATARGGRMLTQGVRVALAGRPNVGKSSLMNALLGEARSIVSAQAGTTRDYIEERLSIQGFPILLNDTAGLRDSADAVEQEGVKRSRERVLGADVLLLVLDPTRELLPEDLDALDLTKGDTLFVITKNDLDPQWDVTALLSLLRKRGTKMELQELRSSVASVSSKTRAGLDALKLRVLDLALKGQAAGLLDQVVLTQLRHEDAMRRAHAALKHVEATLSSGKLSAEFLSPDLRDALDALGEIVGKTTREDVVNAIFAKFCIGK
jgi:tRNA modification GTPase